LDGGLLGGRPGSLVVAGEHQLGVGVLVVEDDQAAVGGVVAPSAAAQRQVVGVVAGLLLLRLHGLVVDVDDLCGGIQGVAVGDYRRSGVAAEDDDVVDVVVLWGDGLEPGKGRPAAAGGGVGVLGRGPRKGGDHRGACGAAQDRAA